MRIFNWLKWYWVVILVAAVALRLYAIRFGEPFRYHPDEVKLLTTAGRLLDTRFILPDVYFSFGTYPILYTFILSVLIGIYILINLVLGRFESLEYARTLYEQNPFTYLIVGRYFVASIGVISIVLLYLIVSKLYSRKTAILAAALLSINFVHVVNSHFSTVDVPASFLGLCAFYFIVKMLSEPSAGNYLWSAIFIALSVAAKFSLLFYCVPFLYVHLMHAVKRKPRIAAWIDANLLRALFCGLAVFLLACPLFLINARKAWNGLIHTKNFETVGKLGSGGSFLSYWTGHQAEGFGVFYPNSIPTTFGWDLTFLVVLGLLLLVIRRKKQDLLILSFVIPTYLMFEHMAYRAIRHLLPIIPFLIVAAALFISWLSEKLSSRSFRQNMIIIMLFFVIAVTGVHRVSRYLMFLKQPDPRTCAYEWMLKNVPFTAPVAVESFPPFLPGYNEKNDSNAETYTIFEVNLLSRKDNLSSAIVDSLRHHRIQYYLSDGFTRYFFEWNQSKIRYPSIVADRMQFFRWLQDHSEEAVRFVPENIQIQPVVIIYKLNMAHD